MIVLTFLLPYAASMEVSCNYQNWATKEFTGMSYQCTVKDINVQTPNETVTEVTGNYVGKEFTKTVVRIAIRHMVCMFMPKGFENHYENILGLEISGSKLKKIAREDIAPFPKLKDLNFSHNMLTSLDADFLDSNLMLKLLDVSFNRIHTMSVEMLDSIGEVHLNFLKNACLSIEGKNASKTNEIRQEIMKNCQRPVETGCSSCCRNNDVMDALNKLQSDLNDLKHAN